MVTVKIYSTPTCPWCKKAKDFFKKNSVKFIDLNVAKDEKARNEMIEKSQQSSVPVFEIDGEIIIGFDQARIEKALKK